MSSDQPETSTTFDDLGIDKRVLKALKDVGYESPSPIQAATIPALLEDTRRRLRDSWPDAQ